MNEIVLDYSELKKEIKRKFGTQKEFSKVIPMCRSTLNQKLQGHVDFTTSDIYNIINALNISETDISKYFFTLKV